MFGDASNAFFPSPLVGEGGRGAKRRGRVRGLSPRIETPHPARFARHLLPQGEKGRALPQHPPPSSSAKAGDPVFQRRVR